MKNLLIPLVVLVLLVTGCTKENEQNTTSKVQTRTGVVESINFPTTTLEFASMDALNCTIENLTGMTHEQRQQWFAGQSGFVSMNAASIQINDQMRVCNSWDEVKGLQEKYADLFIFDPNTKVLNASPFLKTNKFGYEWVCNAYGDVTVAGKVINFNNITTYAETWLGKAEQESVLTKENPTSITMILWGAPYERSTIVASREVAGLQSTLFISYITQKELAAGFWLNYEDIFTISYSDYCTKTSVFSYYYEPYKFIMKSGDSEKITTTGGSQVKQPVGIYNYAVGASTGYNIYSNCLNTARDIEINLL